jgi:hypothetical protein
MTKHPASTRDQEEPKRPSSASRKKKMGTINKESKKPAKKSARPKMAKGLIMGASEPLLMDNSPTNGSVDPRIAERAYELYQHRGGHHGQDLEDWLTAEREVLSEESCCS